MLGEKINSVKEISTAVNNEAHSEIALKIRQVRKDCWTHEMATESFIEMMLDLRMNTNNEAIRKGVMKMWEEQSLPTLLKPKNPKVAFPFLAPDPSAEVPLSLSVYKGGKGDKGGNVRIQLGEGRIGEDAKHLPVTNTNELLFSFRHNDVDYKIEYDSKATTNKFKLYSPVEDFAKEGYGPADIKGFSKDGKLINIPKEVPKEIRDWIHNIDLIIKGDPKAKNLSGKELNTFENVAQYLENSVEMDPALKKHKFHLLFQAERPPRKGRNDFILLRAKHRSKEDRKLGSIGTIATANALDVTANMQGDYDGDHMRLTHSFNSKELKGMANQFLRESALDEKFPVYDIPLRKINIFGIGMEGNKPSHAGSFPADLSKYKSQILKDSRSIGPLIGSQSAMEWLYLGDFSIGGQKIRDKIGFSMKHLINNRQIYKRGIKASQSGVDFIEGLPKELATKKSTYNDLLYNGERNRDKIFDHEKGSIQADIVHEVLDILRRPSSLFNQVYDETGSNKVNSFHMQQQYTALKKFRRQPNTYVFNRLARKFAKSDTEKEKLTDLITYFLGERTLKIYLFIIRI